MRGNRPGEVGGVRGARSIPACAGEPPAIYGHSVLVRVYPRVCGGTSTGDCLPAAPLGLSPRVRGNRFTAAASAIDDRSIPACAGEPRWILVRTRTFGVYPRVCGGTPGSRRPRPGRWGLSPRVRGNHILFSINISGIRSIPACAGEPQCQQLAAAFGGVYPRVCGGTSIIGGVPQHRVGLSPRVRGNPVRSAGTALR